MNYIRNIKKSSLLQLVQLHYLNIILLSLVSSILFKKMKYKAALEIVCLDFIQFTLHFLLLLFKNERKYNNSLITFDLYLYHIQS